MTVTRQQLLHERDELKSRIAISEQRREDGAGHIRDTARLVEIEEQLRNFPAHALRVVCTKCPAVAKVHYLQTLSKDQSYLEPEVWVECHGEHIYGTLKPQLIDAGARSHQPRPLLLEDVAVWSRDQLDAHFQRAEKTMIDAAERVEHLRRVMERKPPEES